jgi:hypothetical protein
MSNIDTPIRFSATIHRPGGPNQGAPWLFLRLPDDSSKQLPARSMVSVEGTFDGNPFQATLEPDGEGGHWLRIQPELAHTVNATVGTVVELEISPVTKEPEPEVPEDLQSALDSAPPKALETWLNTTALARRDWIYWITTGKKAETRLKRIEVAISKMTAGSKRPCCFDRSGMYDKSLSCPIADTGE